MVLLLTNNFCFNTFKSSQSKSYHSVNDPVFAPTGEDPESKSVIEDDSVMVAVAPLNPSLHIKKTKGEVLK